MSLRRLLWPNTQLGLDGLRSNWDLLLSGLSESTGWAAMDLHIGWRFTGFYIQLDLGRHY